MQHTIGAEGNRIAFEVEGDGPDLILIHGITENRSAWGATRQRLARVGRVVAIDLRGHGDSDLAGTYALDAMAADVKAVADEVGAGLPTLVGHSLGAFVASVYAAAYPTPRWSTSTSHSPSLLSRRTSPRWSPCCAVKPLQV